MFGLLVIGLSGSSEVLKADVNFAFMEANGVFTPIGSTQGDALGINNLGQIVGDLTGSDGDLHGFLDTAGVLTTFTAGIPWGINDAGQIVGQSAGGAFLYDNGTLTTLNGSLATDINNLGQIVGLSGGFDGFLYVNGVYTPVTVPGSLDTIPWGINDAGQIVGTYLSSTGETIGFETTVSNPTVIEPLSQAGLTPTSINDSGQIVASNAFSQSGILDTNGVFTEIFMPNTDGTAAFRNNNAGEIIGVYLAPTALPEPSELLPIALLLVAMGIWLRARSRNNLTNRVPLVAAWNDEKRRLRAEARRQSGGSAPRYCKVL